MNVERLPAERHGLHRYARMPPTPEPEPEGEASSASLVRRPEVLAASASASFRLPEAARVFEELPRAAIISVSRPDAGDITPMLLSYTIEVNYKQAEITVINQCNQLLSPSAEPTYVMTYLSHSFPQHRQYLCAGAWMLMNNQPEINSANLARVLREFSPEEVTANIYTMVDVLLHRIQFELLIESTAKGGEPQLLIESF